MWKDGGLRIDITKIFQKERIKLNIWRNQDQNLLSILISSNPRDVNLGLLWMPCTDLALGSIRKHTLPILIFENFSENRRTTKSGQCYSGPRTPFTPSHDPIITYDDNQEAKLKSGGVMKTMHTKIFPNCRWVNMNHKVGFHTKSGGSSRRIKVSILGRTKSDRVNNSTWAISVNVTKRPR